MIEFFLTGVLSAAAVLFLLWKMDIRKVLYFDVVIDIGFTYLLTVLFSGTYSGMMAAVTGGLFLSATLYFLKRSIGYKAPTISLKHGFRWVTRPPKRRTERSGTESPDLGVST